MRDGRWTTDSVMEAQSEAVRLARKYLTAGTVQGARVIAERDLMEGMTAERVVFEELREASDNRPLTINRLDEAAWCETPDDLYGLPARMVVSRLLRSYLNRNTVVASELLYNFRVLSRLQNHDSNIYPAAVDRVATLQAADRDDLDIRTRRDALYALLDEVGRRARRAEGEKLLWKTGLDDLPKMARRARKAAFDPAEQQFLVRAAIGRDLSGQRSWLGKLDALLGAVSDDLPPDLLAMLDEFIADCLSVSEVIQDILGERPNLAHALIGLIDLIEGRDGDANGGADRSEAASVLARLFAERRLPSSALVVLDRVCREVQGSNPLSRNDPQREHEAYEDLCRRVITRRGLTGEHRMAVAITRRYNHRLPEGGDTGWRKSIVGVAAMLADAARRLHYLAALTHAREAEPYQGLILDLIVDGIKLTRCVDDFADGLPPAEKLATVTSLQRALMDGRGLPEPLVQRMFSHFDDMLLRYVEQSRLIERLDQPDDTLRLRAERLVSFCGSGVLLEGKALAAARTRVLDHLRRPDFMAEFVRDLPPERHEAQVRQFYDRLARAGFRAG